MPFRRALLFVGALAVAAAAARPVSPGAGIDKLRVLTAPGIAETKPKDWHNSLTVVGDSLVLQCAACTPRQSLTIPRAEIASVQYGQNAYHHWVAGLVTGAISPLVGVIVAVMPHHQHFYSIDLKNGHVLGFQADKSDYKRAAGLLNNFTGLPIEVTLRDAHFLDGFNIQIVLPPAKPRP